MSAYHIELLLLFLIVIYSLYKSISFYRDETKLRKYLETSKKAKSWVTKHGIEKTVYLSKKYFLPLGIFLYFVIIIILGVGLFFSL